MTPVTPSNYLNQCWLINKVPWHSYEDIIIGKEDLKIPINKTRLKIAFITLQRVGGWWVDLPRVILTYWGHLDKVWWTCPSLALLLRTTHRLPSSCWEHRRQWSQGPDGSSSRGQWHSEPAQALVLDPGWHWIGPSQPVNKMTAYSGVRL